ncbi:MAG: hypothetical protein CM1200mP12_21340 [Gammaproteobacteria bacterium]|nr:MAG: hypothetical protein CM1200mP12_21340 [Gammaproteobacteria bacterium]
MDVELQQDRCRYFSGQSRNRFYCGSIWLGGIGLNVIQGSKLAGASRIIGVDINSERESLGKKFGMTDFINPKNLIMS